MNKELQNAKELMTIFNHPSMTVPVWVLGDVKKKKHKKRPAGKGKKTFGKNKRRKR